MPSPAPNRTPLAEFVDPWIDGLANQSGRPSPVARHRRDLARYGLPRLGTMAVQDLRVTDSDSLYAHLP